MRHYYYFVDAYTINIKHSYIEYDVLNFILLSMIQQNVLKVSSLKILIGCEYLQATHFEYILTTCAY